MNPIGDTGFTLDDFNSETIPEDLKSQINNFLWTVLGPDTSLRDADEIAMGLYTAIQATWEVA